MRDQTHQFDFDDWMSLAASDADAFERRRRELLQAEIDQAPVALQPRLRGLQWQIDMTRRRCKTPAMASARLFEMMWEQVYGDNGFLDVLTNPRPPVDLPHGQQAGNVLPFRAQKGRD